MVKFASDPDSLLAALGVGVALRDMLRRRVDSGVARPADGAKRAAGRWAGDWFVDPVAPVGVDLGLMMSRLALGFKLKLSSTELSNSSSPPNRDF